MSAKDRTATTDTSGIGAGENKRTNTSAKADQTVVFSPVTTSRERAGQNPAGPRRTVLGTSAGKKQMRRKMVADTLHAWRGRIILALCVILGSVLLVAGVYATSELASSRRDAGAPSGNAKTLDQADEKESVVFSLALEGETEDEAEKSTKDTTDDKTDKEPEKEGAAAPTEPDKETEKADEPEPVYFNVEVRFADREPLWTKTTGETVRELLEEIGYTLDENHFLSNVGPDDYIWTDTVIEIGTIYYSTETVTEYTPFNTVYLDSEDYPAGTTQVTTEGTSGVVEVTYTVEYVNGVETYRSRDSEKVISNPTDQVVTIGTAVSQDEGGGDQGGVIYGADGTAYSYSRVITVRATYYNLPGNTASGLPVGDGVIAVDPSVIPLGTSVYLKNDAMDVGVRVAADTGVYGNTVDIWMNENSPLYSVFAPAGVWEMTCYILD